MKLLYLLPCLLLAAEVRADCDMCKAEIMAMGYQESLGLRDMMDHPAMWYFCEAGLFSCYTAHDCKDEEVKVVAGVASYLCTEDGKAVAESLVTASCPHDYPRGSTLDRSIKACVAAAGDDVCTNADVLRSCLISGGGDVCGPVMATFIENIWDNSIAASLAC